MLRKWQLCNRLSLIVKSLLSSKRQLKTEQLDKSVRSMYDNAESRIVEVSKLMKHSVIEISAISHSKPMRFSVINFSEVVNFSLTTYIGEAPLFSFNYTTKT